MYTILITESNELITSVKERILEKSKLVDTLHFLSDPVYKNIDMSDFNVVMEYILPQSKKYMVEVLCLSEELYKNKLEYKLPFDTSLTKEAGEIQIQLTFTKAEMDEDGKIIQRVRHTTPTTITIIPLEAWSEMIPDEELSNVAQIFLKLDSQINDLRDIAESLDENQPNNLTYKDGYLQLSKNGNGIGDKIKIPENSSSSDAANNIKVIEF